MEQLKSLQRFLLVLLTALAVALAGCSGDDGDPGPPGEQGPPGEPGAGAGEGAEPGGLAQPDFIVIPADITAVNVPAGGGQPTVTFTVSDEDGNAMTDLSQANLQAGELRFIIAKLLPATEFEPPNWQSYINRVETPTAGVGPGGTPALERALQATTEANGTLVNNGGGSYTYTFSTNLTNATNPITGEPIPFDPNLTHRVAIQIEFEEEGEPVRMANPTETFLPAGGTPQDPQVSLTQQCNECHDLLVAHGARFELEYCVMCHNPGSTDANSGNTVDMPVMVHKIHMGRELPSVLGADGELGTEDDGEYAIWGFRNTKHDYSNVGYPQDIRYCTKCHEGETTASAEEEFAPQGDNWKQWPTITNCGSCHDNIIFNPEQQGLTEPFPEFMRQHPVLFPVSNNQCSGCHPADTGGVQGANVADSHRIFAHAAAENFQYNILETQFDSTTRTLAITFSVTEPQTGAAYNIFTNPAFTQTQTGASRLFIDVGWEPEEFQNLDSGVNPAQPIQINLLDQANVEALDNNTYRTTAVIPADVMAVGVALEGHPAVAGEETPDTFDIRVPVTNAFTSVDLAGGEAPMRRQIVSLDKCNVCHNTLSIHGNNRTDNLNVCVMCHNPNATDINRRPATDSLDGKPEEAIDFKTMIHAIHANEIRTDGIVVYGFGATPHDFGLDSTTGEAVRFPGNVENCLNCHVEDGYQLPLEDQTLATTIDTGADIAVPFDDVNISPATALCYYCHDSRRARAHMESNGGEFNLVGTDLGDMIDPMAADSIEFCNSCHGPDGIVPLRAVHAIEEMETIPAPEPVLGPVPEPPGEPGQQPTGPTANAGVDQTVTVGTTVTLDGSASSDPQDDPLTFNWTIQQQPTGSTATLTGADTSTPTFAPQVAGTYVIGLDVTAGGETASDTVTITVNEGDGGGVQPPTTLVFQNSTGDITFSHTNHVGFANNDCLACHTADPTELMVDNAGRAAAHGFCDDCHQEIANNNCGFCHGN